MLVMFDSFDDFFAILCSVVRKVLQRRITVPWWSRYQWDSRVMPWKKQSEIPVPLHHWRVVRNHPIKDLVNEPVVPKANERYFNPRLFHSLIVSLKHRNRVFISSPRGYVDCCFLQRLLRFLGSVDDCWCRSPPMINLIQNSPGHHTGWATNGLLGWGFCVACSMASCDHAPPAGTSWGGGRGTSSSNSAGKLWSSSEGNFKDFPGGCGVKGVCWII